MGRIEKLVILAVLLVIMGILGAVQFWDPAPAGSQGPEPGDEVVLARQTPTTAPRSQPEAPRFELAPQAEAKAEVPGVKEAGTNGEAQGAPATTEPSGDLLTTEGLEQHFAAGLWVYTVKAGDTFRSIATRYYGKPGRSILLVRENEGCDQLEPGQRILVPEVDDGYNGPRVHIVSEGESLWSIAEKAYGKGWMHDKIADANAATLAGGAALKPGMKLILPTID